MPREPGTEALVVLWREEARRLLAAVGWKSEHIRTQFLSGGARLFLSAPVDALFAATEVAEEAWRSAIARQSGAVPDADAPGRLRALIHEERRPWVRALAHGADAHGASFLHDEDGVSVGTGTGSIFFSHDAIPQPDDVNWDAVHDIPLILVTGSNGKTTSVRLIAAMAEAAGLLTGSATTDGVRIGGAQLEADDYSGPMGARRVLRHAAVQCAVLETARGGILRRGLAVRRADAALITNIAEDHFGDWGVNTLEELADVKLVIARVVPDGGAVCLNADDAMLAARGPALSRPPRWFSLDPASPSLAGEGGAAWLDGTTLTLRLNGEARPVMDVRRIPLTMGGAARYNIANVLGAVLAASSLRGPQGDRLIGVEAMQAALASFESSPGTNPGRGNLLEVAGVHVLVDYAHNPHGMAALGQLIQTLPARRRLVLLGQAGDRSDEAIRALARSAWMLRPDRIILKAMDKYRRGRAEGEVPAVLEAELLALGAKPEQIDHADSEVEAVRQALAWAEEGDLLVLLVHETREQVMEELGRRLGG